MVARVKPSAGLDVSREYCERAFYLQHHTDVCPYLPDRVSSLLFLDGRPVGAGYRRLLDEGYRRTGPLLYRPDCRGCRECRVLRVPVAEFRMSRSQRRVWRRGRPVFRVEVREPRTTEEKRALYSRYLQVQHGEAGREVGLDEYMFFLESTSLPGLTKEVQLRDGGRLAGVGIVDLLGDALSSVYFYFDPAYAKFSPGTFSALAEIDLARQWGMAYYYLGYFIAGCRSMNYKDRFRPCQIKGVGEDEWHTVA